MKCLYAYTQTQYRGYPGYVNFSETETDKFTMLTVRASGGTGTQVASLLLEDDVLKELADAIGKHLKSRGLA